MYARWFVKYTCKCNDRVYSQEGIGIGQNTTICRQLGNWPCQVRSQFCVILTTVCTAKLYYTLKVTSALSISYHAQGWVQREWPEVRILRRRVKLNGVRVYVGWHEGIHEKPIYWYTASPIQHTSGISNAILQLVFFNPGTVGLRDFRDERKILLNCEPDFAILSAINSYRSRQCQLQRISLIWLHVWQWSIYTCIHCSGYRASLFVCQWWGKEEASSSSRYTSQRLMLMLISL